MEHPQTDPYLQRPSPPGLITSGRLIVASVLGIGLLINHNSAPQPVEPDYLVVEQSYIPASELAVPSPEPMAVPPPRAEPAVSRVRLPEYKKHLHVEINRMGAKYGLPPQLIANFIFQESSFNPNAVSDEGAMGLLQLMPGTVEDIKRRNGITGEVNMFDPVQNLDFGGYYMRYLLNRFAPNQPFTPEVVRTLAIAYHGGPGAAIKFNTAQRNYSQSGLGPRTTNYSMQAAAMWQRVLAENSTTG